MFKKVTYFALLMAIALSVRAESGSYPLDTAPIDPEDKVSLQRGAIYFANYCFSCHSAAYMRYNRMIKDLQIDESVVKQQMIFTAAKIGETMNVAMKKEDAARWFGTAPPDLSVVARSRGADWLYTYLRSFYKDESRPWGVNNAVFKDVAMPHVLWELQGLQEAQREKHTNEDGNEVSVITGFKLLQKGNMEPEAFNKAVADIVNFLVYIGEPAKSTRQNMGKWVIAYLLILLVFIIALKKEFWKDVH